MRPAACSLAVALLPALANAAPIVLTHSGHLLDESDAPVTATGLEMAFRILDRSTREDGETARWSGSCAVDVSNGLYSVSLGAGGCGDPIDTAALPPDEASFLEVTVAGVALSPRLRLGTVPSAGFALDAGAIGGQSLQALDARYPRFGATAQPGDLDLSGSVAAGSFVGDGAGLTNLDAAAIATGTLDADRLPALDAGSVTSGTLDADRLPAVVARLDGDAVFSGEVKADSFSGSGEGLTSLDAEQITTGTVARERLPSTVAFTDAGATFGGAVHASGFNGSGAGLTELDAGQITSGTLARERLPGSVAHTDALSTDSTLTFGDGSVQKAAFPFSLVSQKDPFGDGSQVAWLRFEDSYADEMGKYSGTPQGSPIFDSGRFGRGLRVSNNNWFRSTSNVTIAGAASRTLMAWVKLWSLSQADASGLVGWGTSESNARLFHLVPSIATVPQWGIWGHGAPFDVYSGAKPDLNWHHLAVTYDGDTVRLFVDGQYVAQKTCALNSEANVPLQVGRSPRGSANAVVDSVRLFTRQLSPWEIQSLYFLGQ